MDNMEKGSWWSRRSRRGKIFYVVVALILVMAAGCNLEDETEVAEDGSTTATEPATTTQLIEAEDENVEDVRDEYLAAWERLKDEGATAATHVAAGMRTYPMIEGTTRDDLIEALAWMQMMPDEVASMTPFPGAEEAHRSLRRAADHYAETSRLLIIALDNDDESSSERALEKMETANSEMAYARESLEAILVGIPAPEKLPSSPLATETGATGPTTATSLAETAMSVGESAVADSSETGGRSAFGTPAKIGDAIVRVETPVVVREWIDDSLRERRERVEFWVEIEYTGSDILFYSWIDFWIGRGEPTHIPVGMVSKTPAFPDTDGHLESGETVAGWLAWEGEKIDGPLVARYSVFLDSRHLEHVWHE